MRVLELGSGRWRVRCVRALCHEGTGLEKRLLALIVGLRCECGKYYCSGGETSARGVVVCGYARGVAGSWLAVIIFSVVRTLGAFDVSKPVPAGDASDTASEARLTQDQAEPHD